MQFGMPTLIENRSLDENIALCKALGLNFIELNMNFPEYGIGALEDPAVFEKAEAAGIYYTIHLDETFNIADFNPLVRSAYLETLERTIVCAKKYLPLIDRFSTEETPRALTINMHMNHGIHITLPDRFVDMYARDFEVYMAYFRKFREKAESLIGDSPIRISIENTDGFKDFEKAAILYLLESPCFTLTWDIGHSKAAKEKDVPFITEHQDRLVHFHIHDGREDPPKNHLALGDGEIDLKARLSLAKKLNSRCVLETKTVAALKTSVGKLSLYLT